MKKYEYRCNRCLIIEERWLLNSKEPSNSIPCPKCGGQCAEKRWIKLHHPKRLAEVIRGVKFVNGLEEKRIAA